MTSTADTRPLAFAGTGLDRVTERRGDESWVYGQLAGPGSAIVAVARDGVVLRSGADPVAAYLSGEDVAALGGGEPLLLGVRDGRTHFAAAIDAAPEDVRARGLRVASLRDAGAWLPHDEGALLAYAQALLEWHRRSRFCSVCGSATEVREAGHLRACPRCGALHHPRTDPVVITLVTDGPRALLGRQPSWPEGRYSALAGFVEPGETLDEAVAREVREEARVTVASIRYQASQPWPFPASLMLGFIASYAGGEPAVGDGELDDVRWFECDQLRAALDGGGWPKLPGPVAIARRLIEVWLPTAERVPAG